MMRPGDSLGRYLLLGVLGRGGFATVYRAHDPQLDREVALKLLLPHLAEDSIIRRRFPAEARAIARLSHPNIITIHEAGETGDQPYYTMELIRGRTLADELSACGPLTLDHALTIVQPLAAAIDHLHAAGLVHRDIKSANIMLAKDGRLLLMDFGIARVLDGTQYTSTGAVLGTPEAMAPEQALGEPVGPAADIYALGILVYKLLAGRPPFVGTYPFVLRAHAYEPPPALEDIRPELPRPVYQAINVALAKNPVERPQSACAFAMSLQNAHLTPIDMSATVTLPPRRTSNSSATSSPSPTVSAEGATTVRDERFSYEASTSNPGSPTLPRECRFRLSKGHCLIAAEWALYVNSSDTPYVSRCDAHIDAERKSLRRSHPDWKISRPRLLDK